MKIPFSNSGTEMVPCHIETDQLWPPPTQPMLPGQEAPFLGFRPPASAKQLGQALGPTSPGKTKGRSCLGFSPKAMTSH
ncbi:unnamed protein product [Prunus armeniaca]